MGEDEPGLDKTRSETLLNAMRSFVKKLLRKNLCSIPVLLTSMVYLQRIRTSSNYRVTRESFCVLTTVCLYIACKFLYDGVYPITHWATISGFAVADISFAEREMLHVLQWALFVTEEDLQQLILRRVPPRQAQFAGAV